MIKIKQLLLLAVSISILFNACSLTKQVAGQRLGYHQLSASDRQLADTLLKKALENEGLFTIISGLKPMSTVADLSLQLAQKDTTAKGKAQVADINSNDYMKLLQYQRIVNALQFEDIGFVLYPFKMHQKGNRNATISIYRQSLIDSMVNVNASFYGQFAISKGVPAPLLVGITEYETSYDRFRSYGNLFGYPSHAVNFFVEAAISNDQTKTFVKRDFFNMPVYSRETGRFVYALPKDSKPSAQDLQIKERAAYALNQFKKIRERFTRKDGTVDYYQLFLKVAQFAN
jgi:hypothetical protein